MDQSSKTYHVLRLLKRVSTSMKQEMHRVFGEMNLTPPQGMLIAALNHHGPKKMTDLSEIMNLSNSTVSGIVDRLEKAGMVDRKRSTEDRRVVTIDLTDACKKEVVCRFQEADKLMEKMIESATESELDTIISGLLTLETVIHRYKEGNSKHE